MRVEKDVFTDGRVRGRIVGEAYNLLQLNRDTEADKKPLSKTVTSRAGLLGLKFKF